MNLHAHRGRFQVWGPAVSPCRPARSRAAQVVYGWARALQRAGRVRRESPALPVRRASDYFLALKTKCPEKRSFAAFVLCGSN